MYDPQSREDNYVFLNIADAFVQLVVRSRLHYLYKQSSGARKLSVAKHCRQYLLAAIDGLHTANECSNLTIDDFPLLADVAMRTPLKRYVLNLAEDSDGSMGEETEFETENERSRPMRQHNMAEIEEM